MVGIPCVYKQVVSLVIQTLTLVHFNDVHLQETIHAAVIIQTAWPTIKEVNDKLAIDHFDSPPYNLLSRSGYRVSVDYYIHDDLEDCRTDRMCECLPFGGSDCDLTNAPPDIPVAAYSSSIHVYVSVSKSVWYTAANTINNKSFMVQNFCGFCGFLINHESFTYQLNYFSCFALYSKTIA